MTAADTFTKQAIVYAKTHPIVPVDEAKKPLVALAEASQSEDVIGAWVAELQPSGIGLRTDRLVVVDVAPGAEDELERLQQDLGTLPLTREQRTPSGGRHRLYRLPSGSTLMSETLAPGVELIAGPGRYVVVPPSRNGQGAYEWVTPSGAKQPAALVEFAPEWVTRLNGQHVAPEKAPPPMPAERPPLAERKTVAVVGTPTGDLIADINATDVGNGIRIATRHGHDLRYCYAFAHWLVWDGRRWSRDEDGEPMRRAKENARWLAASAVELDNDDRRKAMFKWALESEKESRVRSALTMAQSEPGIPVATAELDQDPWLLNVENGTLDLQTGQLREHNRADLITKLAPVRFDPAAKAPLWESVLERALPDPAMREYVQLLAGYALTGSTREQRIAIWWGSGSNAKSTVINTILSLLGEDYGQEAAPSVFLERRSDGIPNDVARLRGARLVVAVETAQNRRLNEALVKAMTGGDRLVARFMRSEFFEFMPTFTPVLVTNHLPIVADTTHALWRRVDIVPFTETIGEAERDLDLPDKLRAEMPGILNWALAGCLAWQENGLVRADAIVEATSHYRTDMDVMGRFIADCCNTNAAASTSATTLFNRYQYWADANGEEKLNASHFGRRLTDLGFKSARGTAGKRLWKGIETVSEGKSDAKVTPSDASDASP